MAIDSRQKRMNMLAVASPIAWSPSFEADGAVDADDRGHLLHLYSGNAFDSPTAPSGQLLSIRHVKNFNRDVSGGFR